MKKWLVLWAVGLSVGCGTASVSEDTELGTVTGAQCSSCPTGTVTSGYYCDGSCDPDNDCELSWTGYTCTSITPITGSISQCVRGTCPTGYYASSYSFDSNCVHPPTNTSTDPNQTTCVPVPTPTTGLTYTVCSAGASCATGYHLQSRTYVAGCDIPSHPNPNATICVGN